MTTIVFHGLLAQKFGKKIKLHLGKLNDFTIAIDAIKKGFRDFLVKLNNNQQGYSVRYEKNGKEIHLIPTILGFGKSFLMWIAIIIIVVAIIVATILFPPAGALSALFTGSITTAGVTTVTFATAAIGLAFTVGVSLLMTALQMPSGPGSNNPAGQAMSDTGGSTTTTDPEAKAFVFDNLQNTATQGDSLPIGYGRMKIGSHVINVSKSTYSLDQFFNDEIAIKTTPIYLYD